MNIFKHKNSEKVQHPLSILTGIIQYIDQPWNDTPRENHESKKAQRKNHVTYGY